MIVPGLHSVTFRALEVPEIAALAAGAGLSAIEWNGDVHVPPGDDNAADTARAVTVDRGLSISGYGSYHHAGDDPVADFGPILETAARLGAPEIRVWAGRRGSGEAMPGDRARVADALLTIASAAAAVGVRLALEFHSDTLADTPDSALDLLRAVGESNVRTHWQPPVGLPDADALDGLQAIAPHLGSLHVFSWWPAHERRPLEVRATLWTAAFDHVMRLPDDHPALLEFVADDDPERMRSDAAVLLRLVAVASQ